MHIHIVEIENKTILKYLVGVELIVKKLLY